METTTAVASLSHSADDSEAFPSYRGWRVLFASVVGLAFSPGPMIFGSFGLFAPHLHEHFGWSLGQIMLSLTLFNIASVLTAPYTGRLIDRMASARYCFPRCLRFCAASSASPTQSRPSGVSMCSRPCGAH